jgi:hypothetical protein
MTPVRSVHQAFLLTIASEIPLVELPVVEDGADAPPDVEVRIGRVEELPPRAEGWSVVATPGEVRGWIPGGGGFRVRGGREIVVDPAPDADARALRLGIVGPLLGVILGQRDRFVLHASTVAVDGQAAAFFGPSGRGKSTLTAAFTRAGHPLIADDMTVIDTSSDAPRVEPGFPRVKLWPDSALALRHDPEALPLIHPERTKRSLQVSSSFPRAAVPLARCYLLEDGPEESSATIPVREAVMALVASTYQAAWLHATGLSRRNLQDCGALVRSGVVRRLQRRRTFEALDDVVRFVEGDLRRVPSV